MAVLLCLPLGERLPVNGHQSRTLDLWEDCLPLLAYKQGVSIHHGLLPDSEIHNGSYMVRRQYKPGSNTVFVLGNVATSSSSVSQVTDLSE